MSGKTIKYGPDLPQLPSVDAMKVKAESELPQAVPAPDLNAKPEGVRTEIVANRDDGTTKTYVFWRKDN